MQEAGYTADEIQFLKAEVWTIQKRTRRGQTGEWRLYRLKMYEPAMRHLIDNYIRAEESKKIASFDDIPLVQLLVERGADAVAALPKGIRIAEKETRETIENNVRRLISDEQPLIQNTMTKMSELLGCPHCANARRKR